MNDYQEGQRIKKFWGAFAWVMGTPCVGEIDKVRRAAAALKSCTMGENDGSTGDQSVST